MRRRRELVNVSEASRRTGVPRKTISSWVARQRLQAIGLDAEGVKLYDLEHVRMLATGARVRQT